MLFRRIVPAFVLACVVSLTSFAPPLGAAPARVDASSLGALHWRSIGPFRGGRAVAVSGVPGDPNTFYFGAVGGGVWKSTNAGRTWAPIMDSQPVASIGAIAVAPSDPQTVYVGSGEADMRSDIVHGNGMYRSTDAGATWTHIGLGDTRQIGRILVDPTDARTLLVAALGHAYAPSDERGVFRSTDGGATWTRTLFHDRDTGAIDLAADPAHHVIFASLWQTRRPPWNTYPPSNGPGSGLYRSTDGGVTWTQIHGGLPSENLGKIGLAVAPSDPTRVYAIVDAKAGGLYRSDDTGATWRRVDSDPRIWDRGWYFCHIAVDPKNPDLVYISDTSVYRSTDGGTRFTALKGSPDGDDFHQMWIDPTEPRRMVLGSDQGTSVSVDGARTWSSWFNQPTGQFYHVATDTAFPYRVYGAQQDSGAAMIFSRSDNRGIEERDWRPINAGGESGFIMPDPRDHDIVFGGSDGVGVVREDLRSNQIRAITPTVGRPGPWRAEWTLPLAVGADNALYFGNQEIFRSRDGGNSWRAISGDLSRPHAGVPATLDAPTAADADIAPGAPTTGGANKRLGVVYALAPSPLRANIVWAGTDDGLVYRTADDGKTWHNITPPQIVPWQHVAGIDASHFNAQTAYVAVEAHRLDDDHPFIYVTHDAGRTWREGHAGIPDGSFVNAVREDPVQRGLLYAATETGVYVSFDDGAQWTSLRLNMPIVSVRDISVRRSDLVIATHGRAFWILDDIAPLRELQRDPAQHARLFAPRDAVRTRPGDDQAEATPPETPLGENPPNGAYIDYVVPADAHGPLQLTIVDRAGATVRHWSSTDATVARNPDSVPFPAYWITPQTPPDATPGMHRFVWNFHSRRENGPLAAPGTYTVRMSLDGRTFTQQLHVHRDPRIRASDADLVAQAVLANDIDALRTRVHAVAHKENTPLAHDEALLAELEAAVESADTAPTANEREVWKTLRTQTLRMLNGGSG